MSDFYTLITTTGQQKLADAIVNHTTVKLQEMAVGDGGGSPVTPTGGETALAGEQYRAQLNSIHTDLTNPNWVICELIIPENVGGWYLREVGLYDDEGDLIAYGNFPETYKPELDEGSSRTQTIRVVILVSDTDSVELLIDPAVVLATREYVDERIDTIDQVTQTPYKLVVVDGVIGLEEQS